MNLDKLKNLIKSEIGVLVYFSGEDCNVCHAVRPKFKGLFEESFPLVKQIYLDANDNPEISADFQVFSVPTMLVFLDGKEFIREGRSVSLYQLKEKLSRPYNMMTS